MSAASATREQLLARQDELCRKLNDAEAATALSTRKAKADLALAKKAADALLEEYIYMYICIYLFIYI
jgi:hypothetical protein